MKPAATIYKTPGAKAEIIRLYDEKLASCRVGYQDLYVDTFAGKTHVIVTGEASLPALVLLHGINAGAPLALEAMEGLYEKYRIYAIDTIGQATKSDEKVLPIDDLSLGRWLSETMDGLGLNKAVVIGVSYGAFLLQKLMQSDPAKIQKAIFVVPSGFVNGRVWKSIQKLSIPLLKFLFTKKEADLLRFMDAFYTTKDPHSVAMQKAVLLGVKVDYRRPRLLTKTDVSEFNQLSIPVYAMVADDDIFFPGEEALKRCRDIFANFKEAYVLKNTKHIPDRSVYPEISGQIEKWIRS